MEFFFDIFQNLIDQFTNPKKRVFVLYLFLSILIATGWLIFYKKKSLKDSFKFIFSRKIFFSKSAKSDYKVFFINQIIMLLVSPHLLTQITIATALYFFFFEIQFIEMGLFSSAPQYLIISLFTLTHFVVDDFSKYIVHRWMHKWPFLWALHKVHHSATNLTPMTVFRTHPLEGLVFTLRSAFAQGVTISTFVYFFGSGVDLYTILGANLFVFLFNIFGSNLRHSHIGIRYWKWLEYILISPAQHHLHHSVAKEHYNKNYGAALAFWDWIFGFQFQIFSSVFPEFGSGKRIGNDRRLGPWMDMLKKRDQEGSFLSSYWIIFGGCGMALSHCILPIRRASVGL